MQVGNFIYISVLLEIAFSGENVLADVDLVLSFFFQSVIEGSIYDISDEMIDPIFGVKVICEPDCLMYKTHGM